MTAPSVPFTTIAPGETDMASGLVTGLPATMGDNDQHVREAIGDPDGAGAYDDSVINTHDGVSGAPILYGSTPNLVIDCHPGSSSSSHLHGWQYGGARAFGWAAVTDFGLLFSLSGQYATHIIGSAGSAGPTNSKHLFGAGADLIIACIARSREPMANLTLDFGLTDGASSTFEAGTRCRITQATIGIGKFRRFWARLSRTSAGCQSSNYSTDVRFGIATSGSFTAGGLVDVNLFLLKPGNLLPWWEPAHGTRDGNGNYERMGQGGTPVWDKAISFTDAVRLTPS